MGHIHRFHAATMAPSHALAGHPHSFCRNRHCPKCQAAASRRWLAEREAELLPVPYFHVVYTLPSELRDIAYQNKRVVYDLLMKAAAETTLAIAADPKRLGARIGITAVLHTWGSALTQWPTSSPLPAMTAIGVLTATCSVPSGITIFASTLRTLTHDAWHYHLLDFQ